MLILSNEDIQKVLSMKASLEALEATYRDMATGDADFRPRMDIFAPTVRPDGYYRWSTTEGVSRRSGCVAIRIKSDILTWPGGATEEKYCIEPGTYCGLVMLFSTETAEPLAIMPDGIIQHMRTGAAAGLGAKFLARPDAATVGVLGSGGMARSYLQAFCEVRKISRVRVYSPNAEHRTAYADEMGRTLNLSCEPVDSPELVFRGADIVATCTDSMRPTVKASWLEPGTHLTDVKSEEVDAEVMRRCDVRLSLGKGHPPPNAAQVGSGGAFSQVVIGRPEEVARIPVVQARDLGSLPSLVDLLSGRVTGRTDPSQITYFSNGGTQGLQFVAVGSLAYRLARANGLGRAIPSQWLLQNIRD